MAFLGEATGRLLWSVRSVAGKGFEGQSMPEKAPHTSDTVHSDGGRLAGLEGSRAREEKEKMRDLHAGLC